MLKSGLRVSGAPGSRLDEIPWEFSGPTWEFLQPKKIWNKSFLGNEGSKKPWNLLQRCECNNYGFSNTMDVAFLKTSRAMTWRGGKSSLERRKRDVAVANMINAGEIRHTKDDYAIMPAQKRYITVHLVVHLLLLPSYVWGIQHAQPRGSQGAGAHHPPCNKLKDLYRVCRISPRWASHGSAWHGLALSEMLVGEKCAVLSQHRNQCWCGKHNFIKCHQMSSSFAIPPYV